MNANTRRELRERCERGLVRDQLGRLTVECGEVLPLLDSVDRALIVREEALAEDVELPNKSMPLFELMTPEEAAKFWYDEWNHLKDRWNRGWVVARQMAEMLDPSDDSVVECVLCHTVIGYSDAEGFPGGQYSCVDVTACKARQAVHSKHVPADPYEGL